jgi:hypothetical protein
MDINKIINIIRNLNEDAPANSVGGGHIAGTAEAGDDPPVKKKKKKYIYSGRGSRRFWIQNLKKNVQ